ncbi:hypothetical protein P872_25165 [Rhodonellum psychrophilum GCM71 = DSM 17998]|uniref:Uncharacterized protein n=1 Tax=Rhodonellum psychrophilum GCM71 = DSM 17998 TaxID=1123057 RepID=U5C3S1_9BACT|nr:hypothetical protein P872_25165 [Rhodonellum psychrophilum GCM71 = DSM 17998]
MPPSGMLSGFTDFFFVAFRLLNEFNIYANGLELDKKTNFHKRFILRKMRRL